MCGAVVPNMWCRGAKYVVPWCQKCGASWCRWCRDFPQIWRDLGDFPEMLTTSCFPGSHWVPKTPQNSPKTPFLTRNGTKEQTGSPLPKPEAQGNTRNSSYTTIMIDEHINFHDHIQYLKSIGFSKIGLIHRLRSTLPLSSLKTIYLTTIQPIFDYCITVWVPFQKMVHFLIWSKNLEHITSTC